MCNCEQARVPIGVQARKRLNIHALQACGTNLPLILQRTLKTTVTVDRQLVKAIAICSEQLASQYSNVASQYCNVAHKRTSGLTIKFVLSGQKNLS